MPDVLTLGEVMACLRADGQVRLGGTARISVAGAEANVAIGLTRLGHDVVFVGAVGPDQLGELVRRTLRAEGVGIATIRTDPAQTGIVVFEQRVAGLTRVDYHRHGSAGARLSVSDVEEAFAAIPAPPRILHITGVTRLLGALLSAAPVPDPHHRGERIILRGDPPSPVKSLSGCSFRPRCWQAVDACAEHPPALIERGTGHPVACIQQPTTGVRTFGD